MAGLLLLLGFAVSTFAIGGMFDDASSDNEIGEDIPDDIVVDTEFQNVLTDELGADVVEAVEFVEGPLEIDTGDGNDIVVAGSGDDQVILGDGNDAISGGAGNDSVDLGAGNDFYGSETTATLLAPVFGDADLGDDTVFGGSGDDFIVDTLGSNVLDGGAGNDLFQSVDATAEDGVTADRVDGGDGDDTFLVDEGDIVMTGSGNDEVRVVVGDGLGEIAGSEVVTIEDFDPENDVLQLGGVFETDDLRIDVFEDGSGTTVFWNDTALVRVIGGQALTLADIAIAV
jgi:Ca2+-binding RTX toxin-like protein